MSGRSASETAILELAFEPYGEEFLFYRDRYSSGIAVSAQERDEFLNAGFWERRKWVSEVKRRFPAEPPRDGRQVVQHLRAAMPRRFILISAVFAPLCVIVALGADTPIWQSAIWLIVGLFFAYGGVANIVARWQSRRSA
ncbi:hypothetical protein [Sphingopyxis sp. RIFCSPHIGHO2_12_FULL_65_19]|uniref:hypothetical protein n=1 Tax=Sphingopyxis sp. RIFCSPHIGHO2_12_FULL_65_19 TaxID=1802172 RepID=UPI0025E35A5D|nr:hypothetical protein [Sphingopyxis sp. RIFCSPHIGHO2_12_FULL_65_19]